MFINLLPFFKTEKPTPKKIKTDPHFLICPDKNLVGMYNVVEVDECGKKWTIREYKNHYSLHSVTRVFTKKGAKKYIKERLKNKLEREIREKRLEDWKKNNPCRRYP